MRSGQTSLPLIISCISAVVLSFFVLRMDLTSYGMWSDQASYLSAALSLGHDGDLIWEYSDLLRFREQGFPEGPKGIILVSSGRSGEWYHSIAWLYPLIACPLVLIFGYHGMLLMNVALFSILTFLIFRTLSSRLGTGWGMVLAGTLLIFSPTFFYVFIIMGELLNAVLLVAAGYLLLEDYERTDRTRWVKPFVVGVLGGFVSVDKPVHAILAASFIILSAHRWRRTGLFWSIAGLVLAVILYLSANYAMVGELTIRSGARRCFVSDFPTEPWTEQKRSFVGTDSSTAMTGEADAVSPGGFPTVSGSESFFGQYRWAGRIFRLPDIGLALRNGVYFFLGRHTGFLWYQTGAVICFLLFFSTPSLGRRTIIAVAILIDAYAWITLFPHHWSGAHALGNRYFMPVLCMTPFLVPHRVNRFLVVSCIIAGFLFALFAMAPMMPYPVRHLLYTEIHTGRLPYRWGRLEDTQLSQVAHIVLGNRVEVYGGSAYVFGDEPYTDTVSDVIIADAEGSFDLLYVSEYLPDSIPLCVVAGENPLSFAIRNGRNVIRSELAPGSVVDLCFHEPVACSSSPYLARSEVLFHVKVESEKENTRIPDACYFWIGRQSRECFPSILPLRFDMDRNDPLGATISGWGSPEQWGPGSVKWSTDYRAISGFQIETIPDRLKLSVRMKTICPEQMVNVWCNGELVGRWYLLSTDGFVTRSVSVDGTLLRPASSVNILVLESHDLCQSPRQKTRGTEGRSLGVACDWILLERVVQVPVE